MRYWLILISSLLFFSCAHFVKSSKDDEKAKILLQAAVDLYNSQKYSESIETTLNALSLNPDFAQAYNHLGIVYMETKRYKKSMEAFNKALAVKPNYPEIYNNIGVLLNKQERYEEAIEFFKKALHDEKYPTPENAYTNIGYSYYKLNKLTSAKAYHQRALDVLPSFCLANKNMADVYVKEKKYKEAAKYYKKAVKNCPLYHESRYKLGLVLAKIGDIASATSELKTLLIQQKEGPYSEKTQEVLKYLQKENN